MIVRVLGSIKLVTIFLEGGCSDSSSSMVIPSSSSSFSWKWLPFVHSVWFSKNSSGGGIYASLFGGGGDTCVRIGLPMGLKEKVSSSKTCPGSSLPNGASSLNPFGVGAW